MHSRLSDSFNGDANHNVKWCAVLASICDLPEVLKHGSR